MLDKAPNDKRLTNVSAWNNNCGAHVFLQGFIEHWGKLDFKQPCYNSMLTALAQAGGVPPTADALKGMFEEFNPLECESVFGQSIREHIIDTIAKEDEFRDSLFQSFNFAMNESLLNQMNHEKESLKGSMDEKFQKANPDIFKDCLKVLKVLVKEKNIDWSKLDKDKLLDELWEGFDQYSNDKSLTWLQCYWNETGFAKTCEFMKDSDNSYMFSQDELQRYAKCMNIDIHVVNNNQEQTLGDNILNPLFSLTIVNSGLHWQYHAASHISDDEIALRNAQFNLAPEDRDNRFYDLNDSFKRPSVGNSYHPLKKQREDKQTSWTLFDGLFKHAGTLMSKLRY